MVDVALSAIFLILSPVSQTARQFLAQCCSLLRFEPASSAEGKLCLRAREELEMLEAFMAQRIQ